MGASFTSRGGCMGGSGGSSYGSMGSMEPPLWAGATTKKY